MTTVRHLGTANPATPFSTIERRSIAVNTANRQIAVGDENAGTAGVPLSLIAVRYFDVRGIYAINDLVVNNGGLYRAVAATGPGAFNTSHWVDITGTVVVNDTPPAAAQGSLWWESDTGILWLYYNDGNTGQWVQAGGAAPTDPNKVSKTGDTMSGALAISATTPSTSALTGALTVAGGVGIGGRLQAGDVIQSTAQDGLQCVVAAGQYGRVRTAVAGQRAHTFGTWANGNFVVEDQTVGQIRFAIGINGDAWVPSTTPSTSPTTGALVVAGGVGVGGTLHVGNSFSWNASVAAPGLANMSTGIAFESASGAVFMSRSTGGVLFLNQNDEGIIQTFNRLGVAVGSISIQTTTTAYNTTSDIRGKPNRELLPLNTARGIVDALEVYDFDKDGNSIRGIGLVAQQAHAVHKSLATPGETEDKWWMAEKAAPVPFMIANIQQLNQRIDELERRLAREP